MKLLLRVIIAFGLSHMVAHTWAQCNNTPNIDNDATVASIGTTTATLGGNISTDGGPQCDVVDAGIQWSTTSGGPYTTLTSGTTSTGSFTVNVTGLPSGSQIYFRAWVANNNPDNSENTDYSNEEFFYTLAPAPAEHAASLTATAQNSDEILLEFPAASAITNADGYIILMRTGNDPTTTGLNNGNAPNSANYFRAIVSSSSATDYLVTGLNGGTEYRFAIIPYNRAGHDDTYHYLTSPGFIVASATTTPEVSISALTNGLATSPVNSATTNRGLMGFQLNASSGITFQGLVINLSSTTAGKFTNFRLVSSANNTFDNIATDPPVPGASVSVSPTALTITLSQALTGTHNYFLVADVEPTATNSTPSVTFQYDEGDFTFSGGNVSGTVNQQRTYGFNDVTAPVLLSTVPADNATGVDFNINKLTLTFNENVDNINTGASMNAHRVIIYNAATDAQVLVIPRNTLNGNGTTVVEVPITPGTLQPNTSYYVQVGGSVIEDTSPQDNNWGGISDKTTWNFTTSGVTINAVTSAICGGAFQPIGDIVISEQAAGDFITSGSVHLDFSNTNYGFDISTVTVSAGPAGNTDITSVSISPKTLTRLTLNFTLDGTNDKVDVITISGLKVYASSPGSTTIVNGSSLTGVWAIAQPVTFATINVGASAPAPPVLEASQDLLFCHNEDISSATVAVQNTSGTFVWYSDASLSTPLATGAQVSVQALGINSSAVGTVTRHVVRVDGCQSASLPVTFVVAPIPVADAGPASVSVCSGSPVTLGGSPTLIGPSVSGGYQYLWSTNPPGGFVDMGPNPVITPVSDTDVTLYYTVKIVDSNGCASDILDPNATIAVEVDSTDQGIVYNSPLATNFTLNSDPIELDATPSINSSYSGSGVYLSNGTYYFDPDLAGIAGSPHAITYTTELDNGCVVSDVRQFNVTNASGSIVNLANSYCADEAADPAKTLSLGPDWAAYLASDAAWYQANYGYTYEFYDFQTYIGSNAPGTGIEGAGANQYVNPATLQVYPYGTGNYAYVGMRVRRKYPETILGIPTGNYLYDAPIFWMIQYVNVYQIPPLKIAGIRNGQVICDVNEQIELEANFETGTFEISRDGTNWISGPTSGIVDNPANSGKAVLNPHTAYTSTAFPSPHNTPASGLTQFYIRYTYVVPNTTGSNNSACEAVITIPFYISNNPSVAWAPIAKTEFCYEDPNIGISTINPNDASLVDTFGGFGVFDNGNRTAFFDPSEALAAKAFANNVPPYTDYFTPEDIILSATRTNQYGCATTITRTVKVHPLYPASFTESDLALCYEDGPQTIAGGQTNGSFQLWHPNLSKTFNQTTINNFNLRTQFDEAVANGADGTVMQTFNLTFNTFDPGLGCQNSITKTFTVNPPIQMDIGGLTDGLVVCGNGSPLELTGNQPNAGTFQISTSPNSGFVNNANGLTNTTTGMAIFNPAGAGVPAGDPQKSFYIRYSFLGPGCTGTAQVVERIVVNPQPAIAFGGGTPAANTAYCHEQGASPTTVTLTANPTTNVTFTGFGITDNGNGTAIFNPTSGYQQSSLADNQNPLVDQTVRNIVVTARRTDALNCANTATITYIVNPLPTATFVPPQADFCYEDDPVTFTGGQTNVTWQYVYKSTTTPVDYTPPLITQSSTPFNPKSFFDDAVSKGANALATLQFELTYTAINSTTGCTNRKDPVVLTVSPRIPVEIAGVDDGAIFCSNLPDKELVFNPPNGTFRINGANESFADGKYIFNPPIGGPAGGTNYTFTYTVITGNNCTNTQEKTVRVLPSPRALFDVQPQCDTALIAYNAQTSTNLPTTTYTWNFSGEIKTGQNVEHRFPGVSTYYAKLRAEHPPFIVNPDSVIVCADSLQLDQIVGPYPRDIRFDYFNICEGDDTNFEVSSSVPLNSVKWDFGDGIVTGFGILSGNITGFPQTSGTYQNPVHRFGGAYDELDVKVTGRTSENFGGCETTYGTTVSILKMWAPEGGELRYDMSQLDNGKGFWVAEDRAGNSSWEFNIATKAVIQTSEPAWVTGSIEPYKGNDISYVNSPCFDLSDFARPVISLQHWTDTETSDGAVLQYSINGGETWERLGSVASGLNWYNRVSISSNPGEQTAESSGWSLTGQHEWLEGKHSLDDLPPNPAREKVRFRIAFASFNNRDKKDGFAFNNLVIEERNRTILVENFTSLNLSEKPNNDNFKAFRAPNGEFNALELVKLQYHHSPAENPNPLDVLHLANPTDQNARAAFYGITNSSRAFIDGGFGQLSPLSNFTSPALEPYFKLRTLVTSPVTIGIDFVNEPSDRLNVKATIQATEDLGEPGHHNVFIAVAERSVENQVYVLRKFLPNASGIPLTSLAPTDAPQEVTVSYDMRHVTRNPDGSFADFAVIVFVQNIQSKDVLQTAMREDGIASPDIVTGIETTRENYLRAYPNPADDILNIILPAPASQATPIKMVDTFGREVYSDVFEVGENVKSLPTKDLSSGVYLVQLSTSRGVIQKKVMVVHD